MKVLLEKVSEQREKWLELRKGKIGSSSVAAVCGLDKYHSTLRLWAEFTGKIQPEDEENDFMWWGNEMEKPIGRWFGRQTRQEVVHADILLQHDDLSWAIATPDFWVYRAIRELEEKPRILETKFTSMKSVPDQFLVQVNWQLGVCSLERGYVGMKTGHRPNDFVYEPWVFSTGLWDMCVEQSLKFFELVEKDIPPATVGSDLQLLAQIQGERVEDSVPLPDKAYDLLRQLEDFSAEKSAVTGQTKRLEMEVKAIKARLLVLMGKNRFGTLADGRVVEASKVRNPGYYVDPFDYINVKVKGEKLL